MQRYFHSETLQVDTEFQLNQADNHHAIRVMRNQLGEKVYVVDDTETAFIAELVKIDNQQGQWRVIKQIQQTNEMPIHVTVACGLSKNDKMDWIVQKGTEMGMTTFIPLQLDRDVVKWDETKAKKRAYRLQKIAKEAAEQSHRIHIPDVFELHTLNQLLQTSEKYTHCLLAYEETAKQGDLSTLALAIDELVPGDSVLVVFGSEGGITPEEAHLMKESGFKPVGLGPRILRAETAPMYFLAVISYTSEINHII